MKVYIEYTIKESAWGGGNQFLKNLSKEFGRQGHLSQSPAKADVILFNSHQNANQITKLKNRYPHKTFAHRVDGPMRLYNNANDKRDDSVYYLNSKIANLTIFQSNFSLKENVKLGMELKSPHCVIGNAADRSIFYPSASCLHPKINLISTSFSDNVNKGFNIYKYLDETLDFNLFEYVFAGKTPIEFKNIKYIGTLNSRGVAKNLRQSDIYITASRNDPCSNSLIEAITCGLRCFALNSGGHPEILNGQGLFSNGEDLTSMLHKNTPQKNNAPNIKDIALQYLENFRV